MNEIVRVKGLCGESSCPIYRGRSWKGVVHSTSWCASSEEAWEDQSGVCLQCQICWNIPKWPLMPLNYSKNLIFPTHWFPPNVTSSDSCGGETETWMLHLWSTKWPFTPSKQYPLPAALIIPILKTTNDNQDGHESEVAETLCRNFYMDDCLRSVSTEGKAKDQTDGLHQACDNPGFCLRKFICNQIKVVSWSWFQRKNDWKTSIS